MLVLLDGSIAHRQTLDSVIRLPVQMGKTPIQYDK